MGDRANIKIVSREGGDIYFYTHWAGTELLQTLQNAMKKAKNDNRLDDDMYLNRIIFCEMIKNHVLNTTGYGISPYVGDGDDRIITVNHNQKIIQYKEDTWTFDFFLELENVPLI